MYKTFISYRRAGGSTIAERLYDYLEMKGYKPFYDITGMESGRFDEQLRSRILSAENFVLILSPSALDRCKDENDWVRREIATAIKHNLNIVLLQDEDFAYPYALPDEISTISNYQAVFYHASNLHKRMEQLCSMLRFPATPFAQQYGKSEQLKKLRFSGNYITQYEDMENGRLLVRKAPATLHQLGNRVWGTTNFGSDKKWLITGKVYGKKRFAGIYYATGELDDGFGTFYLEAKTPYLLEGFWSGYDNENNEIFSGRYLFRKRFDGYTLRLATSKDIPSIIRIADAQLGKNYVNETLVRNILLPQTPQECIVAVNEKKGEILGFCFYDTLSYDRVKEICRGEDISELRFEEKIGYVQTVAVDEKWKNTGIASALVEKCVSLLKKNGIDCFISTAWKHAGIINIASILKKQGFTPKLDIPLYWHESSKTEKFDCPHCGNPCFCSCVIFLKI